MDHSSGAVHGAISRIVELARHEFPLVPVLARALTRQHAQELLRHGATFQIRETYESAMVMGQEALLRLGDPPEVVAETVAIVRAQDAERMALEQIGGMDQSKALIHGNMEPAKSWTLTAATVELLDWWKKSDD